MSSRARLRRRDDRAAVAVEFALIAPLLLLLAAGIIQYGLYFWAMQSGTNAAADAARKLSVGNCLDDGDLQSYVTDRVGSAASSDVVPEVTFHNTTGDTIPSPGDIGGDVSVSVTFSVINLHLPLVPLPNGGVVDRTSDVRVEDTQAGTC